MFDHHPFNLGDERAIQAMWESDKIPLVNGFLFCTAQLFHVPPNLDNCQRSFSPWSEEPLPVFIKREGVQYVDLGKRTDSLNLDKLRIVFGEGSRGSDGFVAVTSNTDFVYWIFFHQNLNPIERVRVDDGVIHAFSTSGYEVCLPLYHPYNGRVVRATQHS